MLKQHQAQQQATLSRPQSSVAHLEHLGEEDDVNSKLDEMTPMADEVHSQKLEGAYSEASTTSEDNMKDSQHTLDMICQAAMDAVIIISENGRIKSVNQEALKMFGYNLWEIAGYNVKMLMPKQYSTGHDGYLERYKKTKVKRIIGQQRTNIHGLRKDGSTYPLKLKVSEIVDRNGVVYLAAIKNVAIEEEFQRIKSMVGQMLPKRYHDSLFQDDRLNCGSPALLAGEFSNASVMVVSIDGFYDFLQQVKDPGAILEFLNEMLLVFDESCQAQQLEHIKTVGDSYIVGAGITCTIYDAPIRVMESAIDLVKRVEAVRTTAATMPELAQVLPFLNVRIGISTGRVVSGVTKSHRFGFDVWGSSVAMAQSLKDEAAVNGIKVCKQTFEFTKHRYEFSRSELVLPKRHPLHNQVSQAAAEAGAVSKKREPTITVKQDGALLVESYMYENRK